MLKLGQNIIFKGKKPLKLLNVLYSGKFVIANTNMLIGTQLMKACYIANSPEEYIHEINSLFSKEFTLEDIEKRKGLIESMNNKEKIRKLIELLS